MKIEECSSCQHLATWGHEIRHCAIQKTQPSRKLGVLVHCLARTCENPTILTYINAIALHVFVTVTVKLQKFVMNKPHFSPLEQGSN